MNNFVLYANNDDDDDHNGKSKSIGNDVVAVSVAVCASDDYDDDARTAPYWQLAIRVVPIPILPPPKPPPPPPSHNCRQSARG